MGEADEERAEEDRLNKLLVDGLALLRARKIDETLLTLQEALKTAERLKKQKP